MSTTMKTLGALLFLLPAGTLAAQSAPAAGDARSVKVYDLGAEAPGPDLVLRGEGDKQPSDWTQASRPAAVAQLVRAFVQPPLLANEDVQPLGERWLVLLCRAEQHAWLERYLAAARRQQDQTIAMQCELFAMPETWYAEKVAPALSQPGKPSGSALILAPGEGTDAFRKALTADASCRSVVAPRMKVRPLDASSVSELRQTAYVRDFDVEVQKAAFIANPIIDVVQDGVSIETAAAFVQEGVAGVSLAVTVADLKQPIPEVTANLGGTTLPVKIQCPQLITTQARAA
ncbi:MAG TPA: hypothetical protein VFT55_15875, partial [Planctomycetota bacterium]|nr:hypothetical protein [Planctomycetota bacterium]